jgi:hypothetical protein
MVDTIEALTSRMNDAAKALDFEGARRLRDRISLMRGGADADQARHADNALLDRQQPGAMGLGTSRQQVTPPDGWPPPAKPDPQTSRSNRRR